MSSHLPLLTLSLLLLAACGEDSGDPKDTGTQDTGQHEGGLSHAEDIQPIWDVSCSGCHTGGGTSGDLALDDGYTTMVGVASSQVPSMNLVEATSSNDSYLWHKLNDTQADVGGTGSVMPQGGALDEADLRLIQAWINEAAQP